MQCALDVHDDVVVNGRLHVCLSCVVANVADLGMHVGEWGVGHVSVSVGFDLCSSPTPVVWLVDTHRVQLNPNREWNALGTVVLETLSWET